MSLRLARLVTATLLGSCLTTVALAAAGSQPSLVWRGDVTTARGVVTDVAKAWEKSGHGKIELQPFNTASGLDAVSKGSADIAGSARGSSGGSQDTALTFTPVAWDGLVIIVHRNNPVTNLTLPQLHDIYYGKITNWKDVGGPDEAINVYAVASPGDGVEYSLRRLLFGRGNQPVAAPRLYMNTAKLEEGISIDPDALGVATLAAVHGDPKVKLVHIGGVAPSIASVANGSYPLFTPLYLVTNPNSAKVADAQAFIDFVTSDKAKAILRQHDLLPYPDGASLVSLDPGRRAKILAEVGARPVTELATTSTPAASNPRVSATPAILAAAQTGNTKKVKEAAALAAAATPSLASVAGSATTVRTADLAPSLDGVTGDAITVDLAASRDAHFRRVSGDALVVYGKAHPHRQLADKRAQPSPQVTQATPVGKSTKTAAKASRKGLAKAEKPAKSKVKTYTVGHGDTLYSIARKHAVDIAKVRAWNHLKGNDVRTGQTLIVYR